MNASLTTADRGTHLKTVLVACLFSLVAAVLAANVTGQSRTVSHADGPEIATRGSTERARMPSLSNLVPVVLAVSLPGNAM